MPIIKKEISVGANETVDNVFTGSIYEFLPWNASINLGMTASATGLVATVNTGSDTIQEESAVNILTTFPKIPDDMDVQDVARGGERLVVKVRNTTAGALTFRALAQLSPV
jgi:hypothetical protein